MFGQGFPRGFCGSRRSDIGSEDSGSHSAVDFLRKQKHGGNEGGLNGFGRFGFRGEPDIGSASCHGSDDESTCSSKSRVGDDMRGTGDEGRQGCLSVGEDGRSDSSTLSKHSRGK